MGNTIDRELDEAGRTGRLNLSNHSVNQVPSRVLQKLPYDALVELQLNNNQLLALPSQLGKLVRLQVLSVRNNALIALPSEVTKLTSLQELDLYSNKIAKLPSSLGKLTSLTRLILQQNKLSSLPSSIGDLTGLQLLYIANNKLTSLPDSIGNLKDLTILSVSENSLKALPASIGGLTSLTSLNVSKNKLTELPPTLGKLAGLVQLIACNNRITNVPDELSSLNSLQTVDLAFNKLQTVPQRWFEKWVSVETLRLNNNQLTELPASLGNLANLTSLDVKDNRIKDLPPEIGYLKNLRELMIDGNKLNALPAEFDEIEDSIERFTYDNNPFSSKLLTFDHDELYDEGDEEDFAFSDEDGDWETKLVFQMLKDGEVFVRHEKGKPGQQVHLQISPELDTIQWTQRGPRLRRQISWAGSSKPGVVTEGKDSDKKQSEMRYLKGGTVRVGGGSRVTAGPSRALDVDLFQPSRSPRSPRAPGNVSALLGLAGAAAESKKQEAEKKELPNTITIADVEEVAVGKEAVKHVEGAKACLHSVVVSEDLCFCLVCPERAILLEARSSAERDEWARAFLMLLKYWIKGTIKDSDDDEEDEDDVATSDEDDEEDNSSMQQSRDDDSSAGSSMQQSREDDNQSTMSQSADAVLADAPAVKKKKKKSKEADEEAKKSSGKDGKKKKSKSKSKSGEGSKVKKAKSKSKIARPEADDAAAGEGEKKKRKKKKKKSKDESESGGSVLKKSKSKKLKRKKTKKFANRAEELADIEQAIHSGEVNDDEMRKMVEEIRQLEAETSKLEAEEMRKKEEEDKKIAEDLKLQQQAEGITDEADEEEDEEDRQQAAQQKAEEEKQRLLLKKEQEEADAKRKKQEEAEQLLAAAQREEDEKKRQEEEEKKQKEADEAEERRLKDEEERMRKETEMRLQIENRKKEALEKRAQERQAKLDQLRLGITGKRPDSGAAPAAAAGGVRFAAASTETPRTAEEKKKELFDQRAREREARLAALRNFGQQKKEEAIKEKEELEKEAEERKQRLIALKAASVKRFNEKHAVLQAIKMKEEEIRQKAEEEEKERAAQQQQQQQQQEAESEAAAKATKAAAAAKAAKEKEEREKKEKEEKARKEREKKEKEEKEKAKQMLQPPPQQSPAKSPRGDTARKASVLDAVTSDGSTILAAPQKTRARAPAGKRLPTIRSRADRAEERREQMRQASIPRAERQIATLPKFCRECGTPLRGPFCMSCGAKIEAVQPPASVEVKSMEVQPVLCADVGLTEAEKMRQRIFQRKAAGEGSTIASPDPVQRGVVSAQMSPITQSAESDEDYEEMMRRRRAESIQKKKEDEKQDRKNIIKAFHEKAKEKDENFVEKLVQLKGRRKVQSTLVEKSAKAMNEGDAFLLYSRDTLYVFYGQEANRMEKAKAIELTKRINFHECGGRAQVVTVRRKGDHDFNDKDEKRDAATKTFWQLLGGGKEEDLMSAEAGGNDIAFERTFHSQLILEKLHKVEGQYKSEMVDFGTHPTKDLLEKDKCYLLDCGPGSVYVWLGRNANADHRTWAINYANDIRGQEGRSEWLYVERETDGGESILFREKFVGWGEANEGPLGSPIAGGSPLILKKKKTGTLNRVKSRVRLTSALEKRKKEQERVDIRALHTGVRPVLDVPWANDDGQSGTLEMWTVNTKTYELEEWPKEKHGIFYSAEAFVMLWTYRHGGFTGQSEQIRWLIYYWQGAHASRQDKGASAMKTKDILDIVKRRGGDADTVRVVQGKESLHFLKLFQGRMIVHLGYKEKHSAKKDALYHVRGLSDAFAVRAVQIPTKRKWLNSRDCFLLNSGGKQLFLWQGEGASDALRRQAAVLADVLAKDLGRTGAPVVLKESQPSKEWEKAIGKKQEYPSAAHLKRSHGWRPRLFMCSSTSGEFRVDEVFDYAQEDLESSNIYLLDAWAEVFVWIGSKSYEEDERMAMETAVAYVQGATDGRLLDAPVYSIRENDESLEFTCHFQAWDDGWGAQLVKGKKKTKKKRTETQNVRALLAEFNRVYTYEELQAKPPPKGLDKTKLEQYLSDDEFAKVLQMTKDEFYALPSWKQNKIRQQINLY